MASDAFAYSDGNLQTVSGGVWTNILSGLQVVSGAADAVSFGNQGVAFFGGAASSGDQYSETTYKAGTTVYSCGCGVRLTSTGGGTGYFVVAGVSGGTDANAYQIDAGVANLLSPHISMGVAPVAGDVFRVEISGVTLSIYINGVLKGTKNVGSTYSTGQPGIMSTFNGGYDQHESWSGGDLGGSPPAIVQVNRLLVSQAVKRASTY